MKTFSIMDAIGMIDDNLIIDAKRVQRIKKFNFLKTTAAVAVAAVCITVPLPAATAFGSDMAYSLLYHLAPGIAQTFKPIRKSCVDNGIKMEVVSTNIEGSTSIFCISIQDIEQERIDETVDLFDSYSINCPYDSTGYCSFSEYDEETNTAYFLVHIERMDGKQIKSDKITFSVRELILGKQKYEGLLSDINLNNIPYEPDTQDNVQYRGASSKYGKADAEEFRYLIPAETPLSSPVDGVSVTGIGYIDGALHIQTYYEDIAHTDNHGWLYLIDINGKSVEFDEQYDISFWDNEKKGSYAEKIIEMPYENISSYKLYGNFLTSNGYESGKWEITFEYGK